MGKEPPMDRDEIANIIKTILHLATTKDRERANRAADAILSRLQPSGDGEREICDGCAEYVDQCSCSSPSYADGYAKAIEDAAAIIDDVMRLWSDEDVVTELRRAGLRIRAIAGKDEA